MTFLIDEWSISKQVVAILNLSKWGNKLDVQRTKNLMKTPAQHWKSTKSMRMTPMGISRALQSLLISPIFSMM